MNPSPPLSGPAVIPAGATHALVCLHGFGASGDDFTPLATPLQSALGKVGETLALFCPHAPFPAPMEEAGSPPSRQWFDNAGWTFRDQKGLHAAAHMLESYLLHITRTHGIPRANIAVLGFSQGAMATLFALPQLSAPPSGIIALSGGLTIPPEIDETKPTTPILFIHGLADDVWPADHTVKAESFYKQHGYPTRLELLPGLPHGLDARVLAHTTLFLGEIWNAT